MRLFSGSDADWKQTSTPLASQYPSPSSSPYWLTSNSSATSNPYSNPVHLALANLELIRQARLEIPYYSDSSSASSQNENYYATDGQHEGPVKSEPNVSPLDTIVAETEALSLLLVHARDTPRLRGSRAVAERAAEVARLAALLASSILVCAAELRRPDQQQDYYQYGGQPSAAFSSSSPSRNKKSKKGHRHHDKGRGLERGGREYGHLEAMAGRLAGVRRALEGVVWGS